MHHQIVMKKTMMKMKKKYLKITLERIIWSLHPLQSGMTIPLFSEKLNWNTYRWLSLSGNQKNILCLRKGKSRNHWKPIHHLYVTLYHLEKEKRHVPSFVLLCNCFINLIMQLSFRLEEKPQLQKNYFLSNKEIKFLKQLLKTKPWNKNIQIRPEAIRMFLPV